MLPVQEDLKRWETEAEDTGSNFGGSVMVSDRYAKWSNRETCPQRRTVGWVYVTSEFLLYLKRTRKPIMLKTGALLVISKHAELARKAESKLKIGQREVEGVVPVRARRTIHSSEGEDKDDLKLLLHLHLQLPDRLDRYQQY